MSVIDGTMSVSQAFEEMGRAILKTMADIATQQATMALFKLGAGILTGALVGPTAGAEPRCRWGRHQSHDVSTWGRL